MKVQKLLIGAVLLTVLSLPIFSSEKEHPREASSTLTSPLSLNKSLSFANYRPDGYGSIINFFIAFPIVGLSTVGLGGITACTIVFTSLYLETYGDQEVTKTGMLATVPIFSTLIATGLTILESYYWFFIVPAIVGPISGLLAFGALVPAAILTDRYVRMGDVSREVTAGLVWSWNSFGMFIIPAVLGMIYGFVALGEEIQYRRRLTNMVSPILGVDRIGVSIKI